MYSKINIRLVSTAIFLLSVHFFLVAQSPRNYPPYAEEYKKVVTDGISGQFAKNVIGIGEDIFGAYVNSKGDIIVFAHNPSKQISNEKVAIQSVLADSRVAPSICALPEGRIALFYSKPGEGIYCSMSQKSKDISSWTSPVRITQISLSEGEYAYPTGIWSQGLLHLFYRDGQGGISYLTSQDASQWSPVKTLIRSTVKNGHPYIKATADKQGKIHLLINNGNPNHHPQTSVYYIAYANGIFFRANGKQIATGSMELEQAEKIYDASTRYNKAAIWDITINRLGNPVAVYSQFSNIYGMHSYWYSAWNGKQWESQKICDAYKSFPRDKRETNKNFISTEIYKSGGICLDPQDANTVYLSRPTANVFEIEKWSLKMEQFRKVANVTEKSEKDNILPQAITIPGNKEPILYWCYNYNYSNSKDYLSSVRTNQRFDGFDATFNKNSIIEVATAVADWQIRAYKENPFTSGVARGWRSGVLYNGFFDWAELYEQITGDSKYFNFMKSIFTREYWAVGNRVYNADDICVSQAYLDMYRKYQDESMLIPTLARTSWIIENEPSSNIDNTKGKSDRWWWCDALYMAPAVYTRLYSLTKNEKFIKFADKEFKACYEQLYDPKEQLFFRDSKYLNSKERNGEKVFWGRGNGWVLGGLVEMLKTMPREDNTYRPFYVQLYKEMCARVAKLQSPNGFWHASMLDTETFSDPETSSTTLFTYALAYGINEGYLSSNEYLPVVKKGWKAITSSVDTEGKLGWVQPVGQAPKRIEKSSTQLYGVGGLLMTACEIYRLSDHLQMR